MTGGDTRPWTEVCLPGIHADNDLAGTIDTRAPSTKDAKQSLPAHGPQRGISCGAIEGWICVDNALTS